MHREFPSALIGHVPSLMGTRFGLGRPHPLMGEPEDLRIHHRSTFPNRPEEVNPEGHCRTVPLGFEWLDSS